MKKETREARDSINWEIWERIRREFPVKDDNYDDNRRNALRMILFRWLRAEKTLIDLEDQEILNLAYALALFISPIELKSLPPVLNFQKGSPKK